MRFLCKCLRWVIGDFGLGASSCVGSGVIIRCIGRCPVGGHLRAVNSVSFSPDGKCVVSGSDDKHVKLWDVETGTEVSRHSANNPSSALKSPNPGVR